MAPPAGFVPPTRAAAESDVEESGGRYHRQSWEALRRSTTTTADRHMLPKNLVSSSEDDDQDMEVTIKDDTATDLIGLLRATAMSAADDLEEAGHKLVSAVKPGQEMQFCTTFIECCRQDRAHDDTRQYGRLAEQLCTLDDPAYQAGFEACFATLYTTLHHHHMGYNEVRCTAGLYAHLLATNAVSWRGVLGNCVRMTQEETTPSSRIFIKVLFQELSRQLGIPLLSRRMNQDDPVVRDALFPADSAKNTLFAINFFTSIDLGGVTESAREDLKIRR
ncbi:unnamed protein product [Alopecurus aequalis]